MPFMYYILYYSWRCLSSLPNSLASQEDGEWPIVTRCCASPWVDALLRWRDERSRPAAFGVSIPTSWMVTWCYRIRYVHVPDAFIFVRPLPFAWIHNCRGITTLTAIKMPLTAFDQVNLLSDFIDLSFKASLDRRKLHGSFRTTNRNMP